MKEWFKKYLGWLGFGVWMIGTLFFIVAEFILIPAVPLEKSNCVLNVIAP